MLREAIGASPSSAKRHIIHFRTKSAYGRFLSAFENANELFPVKTVIQPMKIIHAISCSLQAGHPALRHPSIRYVEEDIPIRVHSSHARYLRQPASLRQAGPSIPWGVRQIKAPEAWKETRGSRIRIGVIDTGIDYMHPDLRGRISRGVNLLNRLLLPADDNGHGTHISGTIAASNQESGLVGVAPNAVIHPVKAFDHNGSAYVSDIVLGIDWCVRNRMHIINMSFGMKNRSKSLHEAVRNAYKQGIVVVASSGNEGKNAAIDYPARFTQAISVGATAAHKKIAPFSNRGRSIDIYAPGDKIKSTWLNRKYMELSGTSMATSHVSGVIALMLTIRPGLTPAEIKTLLQKTSNPVVGLKSRSGVKAGEVDAVRALRHLMNDMRSRS
ncbi:peptidase S8 [Paenibacillus flagellatus]|uniref:Peptidase S8 n=2 Tax=Paenibacillus flagellatus TaxID=2211139 RepID=A0A2V5K0S5_9BACL|nr:peptidase S8 [Paenibacillus flagellatus]